MSLVMRFAVTLRAKRKAKGLTQEALSEATGLHRTQISLLERALREPKLTTIVRLADGLEISPGELLQDLDESPRGSDRGGTRTFG